MKKFATYYCALLAILNSLLGYVFSGYNDLMTRQFRHVLLGQPLPPLSTWFTHNPEWPFAFVVIYFIATTTGLTTRVSNNTLVHMLILLLIAEAIILLGALLAYSFPFVPIITPLK